MPAAFGFNNLLTTINFGTKKIYKIALGDNSILKTNFTMNNSVEPEFFFSDYHLVMDTLIPCEHRYLTFKNPNINIDRLTVMYYASDVYVGYYGIRYAGTYTINQSVLSLMTLKTGCSCNRSSLTFPTKTTTVHQYDDVAQPANQSITF